MSYSYDKLIPKKYSFEFKSSKIIRTLMGLVYLLGSIHFFLISGIIAYIRILSPCYKFPDLLMYIIIALQYVEICIPIVSGLYLIHIVYIVFAVIFSNEDEVERAAMVSILSSKDTISTISMRHTMSVRDSKKKSLFVSE